MRRINPGAKNVFVLLLSILAGGYLYLNRKEKGKETTLRDMAGKMETKATDDYVRYFGRIPDVGMIKCEGLVIYYPDKEGTSFLPYPFFVTTPEKKEVLIARTMIAGFPSRAMGEYVNPIFQGWGELDTISVTGKTLNISIKAGMIPTRENLTDTARAFFMTYKQFYVDLEKVVLNAGNEGKVEVASAENTVKEPGPPVILDAFLVRHGGEEDVHELRILFDRPVMIQDLDIEKDGGKRVEGKVYLAEFSMAGIFEHDGGEAFAEGDDFTIRYDIYDYLDRKSEGEMSFTARVEIHSR